VHCPPHPSEPPQALAPQLGVQASFASWHWPVATLQVCVVLGHCVQGWPHPSESPQCLPVQLGAQAVPPSGRPASLGAPPSGPLATRPASGGVAGLTRSAVPTQAFTSAKRIKPRQLGRVTVPGVRSKGPATRQ
jgi:hypothetical protein